MELNYVNHAYCPGVVAKGTVNRSRAPAEGKTTDSRYGCVGTQEEGTDGGPFLRGRCVDLDFLALFLLHSYLLHSNDQSSLTTQSITTHYNIYQYYTHCFLFPLFACPRNPYSRQC